MRVNYIEYYSLENFQVLKAPIANSRSGGWLGSINQKILLTYNYIEIEDWSRKKMDIVKNLSNKYHGWLVGGLESKGERTICFYKS